jgi:hypothetical protein
MIEGIGSPLYFPGDSIASQIVKELSATYLANQPDLFAQEIIARAKAFRERGRAASPPPPTPEF